MLKIALNAKKEETRTYTCIITDAIMKLIYRHSLPPRSYLSIFVDGKMVAKTVFKQNIEFETDKYGSELYVKRFVFRTNKIQTPNSDGE